MKRKITREDAVRIGLACRDLRLAREELRQSGASQAADYVARALKSAEGAERHAWRMVEQSEREARGESGNGEDGQ